MEQSANPGVSVSVVRAFGVALCILIALGAGLVVYSKYVQRRMYPERTLPGGMKKPVLALELVRSKAEVESVLGDGNQEWSKTTREMMREDLRGDSLVFIPLYWLLLVAMSCLLASREPRWASWAGVVAGICVTGAAIFDYLENAGIKAALDTPIAELTDKTAQAIRQPSLVKWALIFIAMGTLAALFWRQDWIKAIAFAYLLVAVIGLVGLIYHPAIEWAFTLMALLILPVALLFTFRPIEFLREF